MDLEERFRCYITDNELVDKSERVLLAVSGGVDSMVMMNLFVKCGWQAGVAHCNFQLRGEEAVEDELSVERNAKELGLPYHGIRFDTADEMRQTGENVQLAARRLRYEWFGKLCTEYGYSAVVIAHHADDSIETFFINMLRGTGLKGLTGIHRVREKIVRPLLFASRRDILDYAHSHKIEYREDSSNRTTKYLRNKIRLGVSPMLREISPKFTETMVANLNRLSQAQQFITATMEGIRGEIVSRQGDVVTIDVDKIDRKGLPRNFVIYELLSSDYGFKGDVVDLLCDALLRGVSGKKFYSHDYVAYTDRGNVAVTHIADDDDCRQHIDAEMTKLCAGGSLLWIKHLDIDNIDTLITPANVALIDADKLQFPLTVRRWREGDSFVPFGMTNHKKVSDFLIYEKVSMAEKQHQRVIVSGEDIVWLIGRRIDNRYRIEKGTENILKIIEETA